MKIELHITICEDLHFPMMYRRLEKFGKQKNFKNLQGTKTSIKIIKSYDVARTKSCSVNSFEIVWKITVVHTRCCDPCKDVLDTLNEIQQNNPQSKIAYSAVFRRKDSHELNAKVTQLNSLLAEELPLHGFDIIDNSNILFSNLKQDGLHLNSGGVRKFAGNLIKFSKYC